MNEWTNGRKKERKKRGPGFFFIVYFRIWVGITEACWFLVYGLVGGVGKNGAFVAKRGDN